MSLAVNGKDSVSGKSAESDGEDDVDVIGVDADGHMLLAGDGNTLGRYVIPSEDLAASRHETGFKVPLYNVWKQQEKTEGSTHFGNSGAPSGFPASVARLLSEAGFRDDIDFPARCTDSGRHLCKTCGFVFNAS